MKPTLLLLMIVFLTVLLIISGCTAKTYQVDYCGEMQMYEGAKESYAPGAAVSLCYSLFADDTSYAFYLDGEKLTVDFDSARGYLIRFTMPDHDVRLSCVTENTMTDTIGVPETVGEPDNSSAEIPAARFLKLIRSETHNTKWDEDSGLLLADSKYSSVTMLAEDAAEFPALAEALEQMAVMQRRSMEEEFDNLVSFAEEALAGNGPAPFRTQKSTLDIQVRRADSLVVSLLADSYADYSLIEEYRAFHGINLDAETGRELTIHDVIRKMDDVVQVIKQELNSHRWSGEFYSETAVEDYFINTPTDGFSWILDYNGITFYFMPGDLCEPGFGYQTATVSFAGHSDLFEEKYFFEPVEYIAELPQNVPFFADLDDISDLEELHFTGFRDGESGICSSFGIYGETDGEYFYKELEAYGYRPYYVKTADGGRYLYLFCERSEDGSRDMLLLVFDVSGGQCSKLGEMNACPGFMFPDSFIQPTDPTAFRLDNRDTAEQEEVYAVGQNGMPVRK